MRRALLLTFATVAGLLVGVSPAAPPVSATPVAPPPTSSVVDPAVLSVLGPEDLPDGCPAPNRHMTLYARELERDAGEIRLGWGVTPDSASFPGPTIEMIEGECLAITVVNDIPEATLAELRDDPELGTPDPVYPLGVSLHVHGVKYTQTSDGTMHSGSWVPSGQARTYVWYAEPRVITPDGRTLSHGTAGYWWYHDHVAGTDSGTGGIGSGLFGGLVVRRPGDAIPDHTYAVAMGDNATLNLRTYPATDTCDPDVTVPAPSPTCFVARHGDTVEFVVFGIGNDFHTFHMHGHTWVDNRTGVLTPTDDATRMIDVIPLGPSASFGFQIVAGAAVRTGDWMIHCHVQTHSDAGMFTFLHVVPSDAPSLGGGSLDGEANRDAAPAPNSRYRGSARLPDVAQAERDLGFYCTLPLSAWDAAKRPHPLT